MAKRSRLGAIGLFALASMGCGEILFEEVETRFEGEEVETQSDDLLWLSTLVRDHRDISVCWSAQADQGEMDTIRETMLGQRSWLAWGDVNLVGWHVCEEDETPDIRLVPGSSMVTSSNARQIIFDFSAGNPSDWGVCNAWGFDRADCFRTSALHEFGHALALKHEHKRADRPPECTATGGNPGNQTYGPWDGESVMGYCGNAAWLSGTDRTGFTAIYGQRNGDDTRLGDYDADGRADILCHDVARGHKWIDYANGSSRYGGADWSRTNGTWCAWDGSRVFKGDFNLDSRTDLLCHDTITGKKWIDYADGSGRFGGSDWSTSASWCASQDALLLVGDVNGDGRDDLVCHNRVTGRQSWDYASTSGVFGGSNWAGNVDYCTGPQDRLFIGDFNGDGYDDILCHDASTGRKGIDFSGDGLHGEDWSRAGGWCGWETAQMFVGDFNGDGRDDLMCQNTMTGELWIDYANGNGQFFGSDFHRTGEWCSSDRGRIHVGDVNLDNRDDLICHDIIGGQVWIDYASSSGAFGGTDWTSDVDFCAHAAGELH